MKIPYKWSRDEAIELCLEALATGSVHGFSPNHDPDLLATDTSFAQNSNGDLTMWRDWGLFEAHFTRWQVGRPWQCGFFIVQAHRMKKPPRWKLLAKELERLGHEIGPGRFTVSGTDYYTVSASGSGASVDRETEQYRNRVMKISLPAQPPLPDRETSLLDPKAKSTSPAIRAVLQDLRTIAAAPDHTWPRWLDQRRPIPGDWAFYLGQLHTLHRDEPHRRDIWTAFGLWLLERARTAAIWPDDEWAWRWADYVLDRPGAVPGNDVTRVCLAALPMTAGEAETIPTDWRARRPEDVHRSRMTLALLRFAAAGEIPLPPLIGPGLAEWQPLLPRLS